MDVASRVARDATLHDAQQCPTIYLRLPSEHSVFESLASGFLCIALTADGTPLYFFAIVPNDASSRVKSCSVALYVRRGDQRTALELRTEQASKRRRVEGLEGLTDAIMQARALMCMQHLQWQLDAIGISWRSVGGVLKFKYDCSPLVVPELTLSCACGTSLSAHSAGSVGWTVRLPEVRSSFHSQGHPQYGNSARCCALSSECLALRGSAEKHAIEFEVIEGGLLFRCAAVNDESMSDFFRHLKALLATSRVALQVGTVLDARRSPSSHHELSQFFDVRVLAHNRVLLEYPRGSSQNVNALEIISECQCARPIVRPSAHPLTLRSFPHANQLDAQMQSLLNSGAHVSAVLHDVKSVYALLRKIDRLQHDRAFTLPHDFHVLGRTTQQLRLVYRSSHAVDITVNDEHSETIVFSAVLAMADGAALALVLPQLLPAEAAIGGWAAEVRVPESGVDGALERFHRYVGISSLLSAYGKFLPILMQELKVFPSGNLTDPTWALATDEVKFVFLRPTPIDLQVQVELASDSKLSLTDLSADVTSFVVKGFVGYVASPPFHVDRLLGFLRLIACPWSLLSVLAPHLPTPTQTPTPTSKTTLPRVQLAVDRFSPQYDRANNIVRFSIYVPDENQLHRAAILHVAYNATENSISSWNAPSLELAGSMHPLLLAAHSRATRAASGSGNSCTLLRALLEAF